MLRNRTFPFILTVILFTSGTLVPGQDFTMPGPDLPLEQRVEELVSRMTLEEKISQMQNGAAAIERLDIPQYDWWNECLHGVARAGTATVFPQAIGMAATWDPDLIRKEADIISTEARAKHNEAVRNGQRRRYQGLTMWSPNINIFRDPRWGRGQETYGEDPYLTSRIGVSFVKGLQGDDPEYFKVVSTVKHYAVHSGPESMRHSFDAEVSDRDLHETYLPAFRACIVEGGAYSVMGAYNRFRGQSASAHELLLNKILRDDWGFKGYIVSDCGAIWDIYNGHHIVETAAEASALAVKRGCDLTCGTEYTALKEAVEKGLITESEIDVAVKRLMTARFRLGMFDPPGYDPYSKIPISENNSGEHNRVSLEVARESMVLLKNENNILPLAGELNSIAVIGPYADNLDVLLGNYNGDPSDPVTILQGIRNRAGKDTEIRYAIGVLPPESEFVSRPIGAENFIPGDGSEEKGLKAEYFNNPDLNGNPALTVRDSAIPAFWSSGSPAEGVRADSFSVRYTGFLVPDKSGKYEIGASGDERLRFTLDGRTVFDNWEPYEKRFARTETFILEKGRQYMIEVDYADFSGSAGLRLTWRQIEGPEEKETRLAEAVDLCRNSDLTIVVAGISPRLEGEEMRVRLEGFEGGDRTSLRLPVSIEHMIRKLHATGKPIVLVLTSGSALAVNWENENIPAILQAWYPGQQGGNAVADVIFGNYNPGGRLPVTFYRSVDDLPAFEDYNMEGRTYRYFRGEPLYAFGHGLSYTDFNYKSIKLSKTKVSEGDEISVSVTLANDGRYDGDEVVQLYVRDLESSQPQPIKSLKGFKRVFVPAGKKTTVSIPLKIKDLGFYDENRGEFVTEPGTFEIQAGASSADIRRTAKLILK